MVDTLEVINRLSRTFGAEAAKELAGVLAAYHDDLRRTLLRDEFSEVRDSFRELAQAQKRTEQRLQELAEAQKRTEQRVEELAEAQKQAEQRLGRLEQAVVELAEAQKRTEQRVGRLEQAVAELAEAQKQAEQRLGRLEQAVVELAEAQKRTEQRVGRLEQAVTELAEAQKRTEQRVEELAEAQKRTEATLTRLIERVDEHEVRLAKLDGRTLESSFREKASAYLGTVLRRTRVVPVGDLGDDLEGVLTPDEWAELTRADVILRGRAQLGGQGCDVYAVVEVSVTVEKEDVVRAARRAGLLRKKGWKVLAVAAGEEVAEGVLATAANEKVAVLQDGRQHNWSEALAAL